MQELMFLTYNCLFFKAKKISDEAFAYLCGTENFLFKMQHFHVANTSKVLWPLLLSHSSNTDYLFVDGRVAFR